MHDERTELQQPNCGSGVCIKSRRSVCRGTSIATLANVMIALDDPNVRRVLDRLHRAERGDWLFFARHPQIVTRILFGKEAGQPGAALSAELKDVYIPMSVLRDKR